MEEYVGPSTDARFGEGLASGYIQATHWEDLAIGAPTRLSGAHVNGSASLTKAVPDAACTTLDGYYETTDSEGHTRTIKVFNDSNIGGVAFVVAEDFDVEVNVGGTSTGATCTMPDGDDADSDRDDMTGYFPAGTRLDLVDGGYWDCSDTHRIFTDTDISAVVEAMAGVSMSVDNTIDLVLDPSAGTLTYSITIDAPALVSAAFFAAGVDFPDECLPFPLSGVGDLVSAGVCE